MRTNLTEYGEDMDLFLDFTNNIRAVGGPRIVANDIVGILVDYLWYAPSHCILLPQRLQRSDPRTYSTLAREVEIAILRDDRIDSCKCEIEQPDSTGKVKVWIGFTLFTGEEYELIGALSSFDTTDFSFLSRAL